MPDFTFTSPEGKSYTVTGPEGATKEQAFQVLQDQLAQGTATPDAGSQPLPPRSTSDRIKDAIAGFQNENPLNKVGGQDVPVPSPTLASAGKAIAGSAAFGGVAGALSPEIVTGLGMAASALPVVGRVVGPTLAETGAALRAARGAAALSGAVSGAAGEGAGQVAEMAGASKGDADAARVVGGMLTPSAGSLIGFVSHGGKLAWNMVQKTLGGEVATGQAVLKARENMARMAEAGQPETAMHAMLQKGIEADRQAADKAADAVLADAHARAGSIAASDAATATRLVDDARTRADQIRAEAANRAAILDKASAGKAAMATQVLAKAAPELAKVGQVQELSDIGNTLRQAVTVRQGEQLAARNEAYQALRAERDAIVTQREAAGQSIDSSPTMRSLKKELAQKLGTQKGFVQTVDPGVRRGYEQVYQALTRDGGQKTSFEAVDQVRRRLGEVAGGQQVEGYDAIGKQAAQRMYAQLTKAQQEFVGTNRAGRNLQKEMQSGYAEATTDLQKFGANAGKKVTAMDRVDPERFAADPKTLPQAFFNSQQGVKDLRELTDNPALVHRLASDYAARSLQGMSAKQAAKWAADNSDWLREVPGLVPRVRAYSEKLQQIERVGGKLAKRSGERAAQATLTRNEGVVAAEKEQAAGIAEAGRVAEGTVKAQERVLKEGQQQASATRDAAFAPSAKLEGILKSGEAPESVRSLLLKGNPEQTRLAARHLATQPGGQVVLEQSVRQSLRNMSEKNLQETWSLRIRPMLQEGKMIPPERLQVLEQDVNRLLTAYRGKDKLSLVQRHIAAAMGTAAGPSY